MHRWPTLMRSGQQQQQCVKSSFLCEMLQSSDIIGKTKDFLEEELPSEVADFITESMTSNQNESVFSNGGASSSSGTGSNPAFPRFENMMWKTC